jgi:CubicO group peptidase (beta-lactamase class C family)
MNAHHKMNRLICWFAIALFMRASAIAQATPQNQYGNTFAQFVLDAMEAAKTPGAAVAIIKGDQVVYAKGFGIASIETNTAITTDTLFRLGSTTKMFTSAALVKAAEEGRLNLNAPIGNYVRGLNPKLAQITVHQLLSHSSGLRDFAATVNSNDDDALSEMVRGWKGDVFFGASGQVYSYSSPGYWLAGFVLEEIGHHSYAEEMKRLIFKPLGMARTTLRPLEAMTFPLAIGHKLEANRPTIIRPAFNNNAMWPAGSIYASVNDLTRWVIAFLNEGKIDGVQVLSPTLIRQLSTPHIGMPGGFNQHHGYGLMLSQERGVSIVSHGGFSTGYGSMIQMAPQQRIGVIVLTNRSGETLPRVWQKALEMNLSFSAPEPEPTAKTITTAEFANCPGVYLHAPRQFTIVKKGERLLLQQEGQEATLKKIGEYTFVHGKNEEKVVVFVPDKAGRITYAFDGMYASRKVRGK